MRALTPVEAALWRRVALSAKPLVGKSIPAEAAPENCAREPVVKLQQTPQAKRHASAPPRVSSPQDRGGEKRVQRGRLEIDAAFDLHGYTQDRGRAALLGFVAGQRAAGARLLLVITGKSGVLRQRLPDWLATPDFRTHLAGFAQAHRRHGGEGAWYVFLKHAT